MFVSRVGRVRSHSTRGSESRVWLLGWDLVVSRAERALVSPVQPRLGDANSQ